MNDYLVALGYKASDERPFCPTVNLIRASSRLEALKLHLPDTKPEWLRPWPGLPLVTEWVDYAPERVMAAFESPCLRLKSQPVFAGARLSGAGSYALRAWLLRGLPGLYEALRLNRETQALSPNPELDSAIKDLVKEHEPEPKSRELVVFEHKQTAGILSYRTQPTKEHPFGQLTSILTIATPTNAKARIRQLRGSLLLAHPSPMPDLVGWPHPDLPYAIHEAMVPMSIAIGLDPVITAFVTEGICGLMGGVNQYKRHLEGLEEHGNDSAGRVQPKGKGGEAKLERLSDYTRSLLKYDATTPLLWAQPVTDVPPHPGRLLLNQAIKEVLGREAPVRGLGVKTKIRHAQRRRG